MSAPEPVRLTAYHQLNEDEFELEEVRAPSLPGPRILEEQAELLEQAARIMRDLATLWKAST